MTETSQSSGSHCFVSTDGELKPRWQSAFPSASGHALGAKVSHGVTPTLLWVRLTPGMRPEETIQAARRAFGDIPIIALSDQPNDEEALVCFAASARGYCNTHAVPELLRRIAEVAAQGGLWIGESLMQRLLHGTARMPLPVSAEAPADWGALLTERERQVAQAVAKGSSNKEIARELGITERTVKAHTGAIFEKLGVRDRLQLVLIVNRR